MDIKSVVAGNLNRLKDEYKLTNLKMAKRCGVGEGTIARACNKQSAIGIDNLQAIASAFHLQAWMLLVPDLDPRNPYIISNITKEEKALYDRLRAAMSTAENKHD